MQHTKSWPACGYSNQATRLVLLLGLNLMPVALACFFFEKSVVEKEKGFDGKVIKISMFV